MIGAVRRAIVCAFGGVLVEDLNTESSGEQARRLVLERDLERQVPAGPSLADEREVELRRLALHVVCTWTDDRASDVEFQEWLERLADYLMRTA